MLWYPCAPHLPSVLSFHFVTPSFAHCMWQLWYIVGIFFSLSLQFLEETNPARQTGAFGFVMSFIYLQRICSLIPFSVFIKLWTFSNTSVLLFDITLRFRKYGIQCCRITHRRTVFPSFNSFDIGSFISFYRFASILKFSFLSRSPFVSLSLYLLLSIAFYSLCVVNNIVTVPCTELFAGLTRNVPRICLQPCRLR